ncbi:hypothetical protein B5X24_HaOG204499 [Helicoverpa armigera]|uniref:Uncharacterized protein n=1 Tax=Helicoverpa armigera TaxID=29058 RepID=A0A2W1BN51_HELAM|nr:hypothetical protein B5X24_HaOG204499 [Helicoverpa armigera]
MLSSCNGEILLCNYEGDVKVSFYIRREPRVLYSDGTQPHHQHKLTALPNDFDTCDPSLKGVWKCVVKLVFANYPQNNRLASCIDSLRVYATEVFDFGLSIFDWYVLDYFASGFVFSEIYERKKKKNYDFQVC